MKFTDRAVFPQIKERNITDRVVGTGSGVVRCASVGRSVLVLYSHEPQLTHTHTPTLNGKVGRSSAIVFCSCTQITDMVIISLFTNPSRTEEKPYCLLRSAFVCLFACFYVIN